MPIVWRDAMSIGNDTLDADHKMLFGIINEFEASPDFTHAEQAAKKLYKYTQEHFRREESLQQLMRYPYADAHRAEHERILSSLTDTIKTHFLQKRGAAEQAEAIARMTELMRTWIVDHVMTTDRRMKPHLGEK
ncbi:MAG TPA: bacteriohemerythrin [Magnetospirillum sp.]|nr:bacteriohemerythrin [Magnetospirillum sp.]